MISDDVNGFDCVALCVLVCYDLINDQWSSCTFTNGSTRGNKPTFPNLDFIHASYHHQRDSHTSTLTMMSLFVILFLLKVAFFLATFSLRNTSPPKTDLSKHPASFKIPTLRSRRRGNWRRLWKIWFANHVLKLGSPSRSALDFFCVVRMEPIKMGGGCWSWRWLKLIPKKCLGVFEVGLNKFDRVGFLRFFKVGPKKVDRGGYSETQRWSSFEGVFWVGSPDVWESRRVLTELARDRTKDS